MCATCTPRRHWASTIATGSTTASAACASPTAARSDTPRSMPRSPPWSTKRWPRLDAARRPGRGDRPGAGGPDRDHATAVGRRAGDGRAAADSRAAQPAWTSRCSTWRSRASTSSALEYRALEKQRETLARRMNLLHQQYDLLVTPQLATTAFAVNHEVPPDNGMKRWWEWSPFTYPFNLTQQPAATRAVRVRAQRAAGGDADRRRQVRRAQGTARGARVRAGAAVRDAGASGGRVAARTDASPSLLGGNGATWGCSDQNLWMLTSRGSMTWAPQASTNLDSAGSLTAQAAVSAASMRRSGPARAAVAAVASNGFALACCRISVGANRHIAERKAKQKLGNTQTGWPRHLPESQRRGRSRTARVPSPIL